MPVARRYGPSPRWDDKNDEFIVAGLQARKSLSVIALEMGASGLRPGTSETVVRNHVGGLKGIAEYLRTKSKLPGEEILAIANWYRDNTHAMRRWRFGRTPVQTGMSNEAKSSAPAKPAEEPVVEEPVVKAPEPPPPEPAPSILWRRKVQNLGRLSPWERAAAERILAIAKADDPRELREAKLKVGRDLVPEALRQWKTIREFLSHRADLTPGEAKDAARRYEENMQSGQAEKVS